eukprot:Nk52_evm65s485 gene=Nk52_evmTU65s485
MGFFSEIEWDHFYQFGFFERRKRHDEMERNLRENELKRLEVWGEDLKAQQSRLVAESEQGERSNEAKLIEEVRNLRKQQKLYSLLVYADAQCKIINSRYPVFSTLVIIVNTIILILSVTYYGSIVDFNDNWMVGPSVDTIIDIGAQYTPCITTTTMELSGHEVKDALNCTMGFGGYIAQIDPPTSTASYVQTDTCSFAKILRTICSNISDAVPVDTVESQKAPRQWWRLISALFVHSGVIHYLVSLVYLLSYGIALERTIGAWKFAILYLLSGAFGNMISAVISPEQVVTGPNAAIMGIQMLLVLDFIFNFQIIIRQNVYPLMVIRTCLLILGLFVFSYACPLSDNFSTIAGMFCGLCLSLIIFPKVMYGQYTDRTLVKLTRFMPVGPHEDGESVGYSESEAFEADNNGERGENIPMGDMNKASGATRGNQRLSRAMEISMFNLINGSYDSARLYENNREIPLEFSESQKQNILGGMGVVPDEEKKDEDDLRDTSLLMPPSVTLGRWRDSSSFHTGNSGESLISSVCENESLVSSSVMEDSPEADGFSIITTTSTLIDHESEAMHSRETLIKGDPMASGSNSRGNTFIGRHMEGLASSRRIPEIAKGVNFQNNYCNTTGPNTTYSAANWYRDDEHSLKRGKSHKRFSGDSLSRKKQKEIFEKEYEMRLKWYQNFLLWLTVRRFCIALGSIFIFVYGAVLFDYLFSDDSDINNLYASTDFESSCESMGGNIVLQNSTSAYALLTSGQSITPVYDRTWVHYLSCIPFTSDMCVGRKWGYYMISLVKCVNGTQEISVGGT